MHKLIAIALLIACGNSDKSDTSAELQKLNDRMRNEKAEVVTMYEMLRDYGVNEIMADEKYKNRVLSVAGQIQRVAKEGKDTVIRMGTPDSIRAILCVHSTLSEREGDIPPAALSPGVGVSLRGVGAGAQLGEPVLLECVVTR